VHPKKRYRVNRRQRLRDVHDDSITECCDRTAECSDTSSAQLGAKLNPGARSTTYQFEYWPTAKSSEVKDLPTSPAAAGSGTNNEFVAQTLTGPTAYGSYSYQVVATNSVAPTRGELVTFVAAALFMSGPTPANPEGIVSSSLDFAIVCERRARARMFFGWLI